MLNRTIRTLRLRLIRLAVEDAGMSTVEYAIGTVAAAAFGAILYGVVTGDSVVGALTNIIDAAREVARLAARGDVAALTGAERLAPAGASIELRRDGAYVRARVSGRSPLLPGLVISGDSVAMVEPDR
jgi:hypothetical protein